MYKRLIEAKVKQQVAKGKSVLILGPRQVGKTTLCHQFKFDIEVNLASIREKHLFEKDPGRLEKIVESSNKKLFIYIDEIQKVPELFNSIQVLIDSKKAQFLITGSSARKIKKQFDINLAPGRLVNFRLDPLNLSESNLGLDEILSYGQLPGICNEPDTDQKELELRSYVENYIEEEIRKETRLRNIAPFARFIEMAAIQSGQLSNFSEISKDLGPTVVTIQNYYQILEDTLFVERIDPYLKNSSRKKLSKASRYLFFDLGVRRILSDESKKFIPTRKGALFEHLIGNEIVKWIRTSAPTARLYYWRDPDGPEIDWLIEHEGHLLPIEVKLTTNPQAKDGKHLKVFMSEYSKAKSALIICTTDLSYRLDSKIRAINYQTLPQELNKWVNAFARD
jgi:predicted AAA+ superfamily ATPase